MRPRSREGREADAKKTTTERSPFSAPRRPIAFPAFFVSSRSHFIFRRHQILSFWQTRPLKRTLQAAPRLRVSAVNRSSAREKTRPSRGADGRVSVSTGTRAPEAGLRLFGD